VLHNVMSWKGDKKCNFLRCIICERPLSLRPHLTFTLGHQHQTTMVTFHGNNLDRLWA